MEMTCPKCHAKMRQYERAGVTIDQCTECRGIFLDRGELEHLIDADAQYNSQQPGPGAAPAAPPPPPQQPSPPAPGAYPPPVSPYGHGGAPYYRHKHGGAHFRHQRHGYGHPHKRRKSFFESLFD